MDFMSDQLSQRRRIRLLTVMDVCTRECLRIEVDHGLLGEQGSVISCDFRQRILEGIYEMASKLKE